MSDFSKPSTPPEPGLTPAQSTFLTALELECGAGDPPTRLLAHIRPTLLARWLGVPAFRKRLRQLLRVSGHRREMTLCFAAIRAAERLGAGVDDAKALGAEQRRTCVQIVKLARESEASKVRQRRTAKSAESGQGEKNLSNVQRVASKHPGDVADDAAALVHPDVSEEEARVLVARLADAPREHGGQ